MKELSRQTEPRTRYAAQVEGEGAPEDPPVRIRGMGAQLRGREGEEGPRGAADGAARAMIPAGGQAA